MSLETASIERHFKWLHLSSIGTQFASLAEEARQQNHSHLRYLDALLGAEVEHASVVRSSCVSRTRTCRASRRWRS